MKKLVLAVLLGSLLISGCALKVIPQPVERGIVNPSDNSLSITRDGVTVKVSSSDTELNAYNLEGFVSSFSVLIDNQSSSEISFGKDAFILLDDAGIQYFPLSPEKVREMVSKESYYLIPYPYVGFYYLEDYERVSAFNRSSSNLPYYYEVYPQDIFTKSLPEGNIIPKAKISGLLYFKIDLAAKKGVKLLVFKKNTPRSAAADFEFPFKIEK